MPRRHLDALALTSIAAAGVYSALVYDRLPDPLPTHFGLDGQPNGWMPKAVAVWAIPGLALALWAFIRFIGRVMPRGDRKRLADSSTPFVAMLTAAFVSAIHVVILYVALTPGAPVLRLAFVLVGAFFTALGLIMPRVRRNPFIGIRTAWTLASDENWARTHRVAGYTMVTGGLLGALAALIPGPFGACLAIACILVATVAPAVYSFYIARRGDA